MKNLKIIVAAGLMTMAASVSAQVCQTQSIQKTTNPDRFVDHEDGSITDVQTGLMWSVCSLGQTYSDGQCSGSAKTFNWTQALQQAQIVNNAGGVAGKADWRLPNIKELGSIVEYQCHNPAINLVAFPDTPSATYWSATPDSRTEQQARSIYFADGSDLTPVVSDYRHVRIVRNRN